MARRDLVMCRSCGTFVEVVEDDGERAVLEDECPDCGGSEFKDNDTGDVLRTDE